MADLDHILSLVARDADQAEADGRLTPAVWDALRASRILRTCIPESAGGQELPPTDTLDFIERLAAVDGSAGWCAMIAATSGCVSGHLDAESATTIYREDGMVVGPFAPLGTATPQGGKYLVSGRWPFVSLCQQSSWIMAGATAPGRGKLLVFVPTEQALIHETWSAMGLCATGSHDVELIGQVVPAEHTVSLDFASPHHPGPLYRFPVRGMLAAGVASVLTGLARGAIDHLAELAQSKTPAYSVRRLAERPATQAGVAVAEARLEACRGLLRNSVRKAWDEAATGTVDLGTSVGIRLAAAHAASESAEVVTSMYRLGGGSSVYLTSPAQRRLRDAYSATQHVMVSSGNYEVAGRWRLGLQVDPSQI